MPCLSAGDPRWIRRTGGCPALSTLPQAAPLSSFHLSTLSAVDPQIGVVSGPVQPPGGLVELLAIVPGLDRVHRADPLCTKTP